MLNSLLVTSVSLLVSGAVAQSGFGNAAGFASTLSEILKDNGGAIPFGPAPAGCADFELLVARGTGEPGPFGGIVGDPLVKGVVEKVPGARGYAVQYPASFEVGSSLNVGSVDVIKRLNAKSKECPNTKFALAGYSQGAGVIHGAFAPTAPKLDAGVADKIVAVVLFGDPIFKGTDTGFGPVSDLPFGLQAKLRENCAKGDPVCDPAGSDFLQHLQYINTQFMEPSIAYVVAGFNGQQLPAAPRRASDKWP